MESRVIFEKWAEREGFDLLKYSSTGGYQSTDTRAAWETWAKRQPEIDALQSEMENLRADAERYRWLRSNARIDWVRGDGAALVIPEPDTGRDWETDTDEHIDAAMKEMK